MSSAMDGETEKEILRKIYARVVEPNQLGWKSKKAEHEPWNMDMVKVPAAWFLGLEEYIQCDFPVDKKPPNKVNLKCQNDSEFVCILYTDLLNLQKFFNLEFDSKVEIEKVTLTTCRACMKTFSSKFSLNRHIKEKHGDPKKFSCNHCAKQYTRQDTYLRHLRSIQDKKAHRYNIRV